MAELINLYQHLMGYFADYPPLHTLASITGLIVLALIANWLAKRVVLRMLQKFVGKTLGRDNQKFLNMPIASRLANIIPALVISGGILTVPHLSETVVSIVQNVARAFIVVTIAIAVGRIFDYINLLYLRRPGAHKKPIKGYLQLAKLIVYLVAGVLVTSILIDRNPLILLSGLGAMAAVLMLIFQDTILSLVASVQISSNNSVRVGDWLEMPQMNADGDVVDIALHTVTVQNWDKTLTVFPTKYLVSQSFKNWRGMTESGARRIKRSILLDQTSVRFITDEEVEHLKQLAPISGYLDEKIADIEAWNSKLSAAGKDSINYRRLTNLGTFRAYADNYLKTNPYVHKEFTSMVRQLQPEPTGIPLEIYCFSNRTAWVEYENIQADIFDHLLAILPEFGLRVVQQPTGSDLQDLAKALQHNPIH